MGCSSTAENQAALDALGKLGRNFLAQIKELHKKVISFLLCFFVKKKWHCHLRPLGSLAQ